MKRTVSIICNIVICVLAVLLNHLEIKELDIILTEIYQMYGELFLNIVALVEILYLSNIASRAILKKIGEKIWTSVLKDIKYKVGEEVKNNPEIYGANIFSQIISVYTVDDGFINEMLENLKTKFENQSEFKDELTYFFLSNITNNNVATFFQLEDMSSEKRQFKSELENLSLNLCDELMHLGIEKNVISTDNFEKYVMMLLHLSLPQNYISTQQMVHAVRTILTWVNNKFDWNYVSNHKESSLMFLIALRQIEQKLIALQIEDKVINSNIKTIDHSSWLKKFIKSSYRNLTRYIRKNKQEDLVKEYAVEVSVIITYIKRLNILKLAKLSILINNRYHHYIKHYCNENGKDSIEVLLLASPLSSVNAENDLAETISILLATIAKKL